MNKKFIVTIFTACFVIQPIAIAQKSSKKSDSDVYREAAINADKDCKWIAKTVKWHDPEKLEPGYSFELEVDGFLINIPPKAKRFVLANNGDIFIYYPNKSVLILSTELLLRSFGLQEYSNRKDRITPIDVADVIFMKTHCDNTPKHEDDAYTWNFALQHKSVYFENPRSITKTKSGKLTYYLSDTDAQPRMSGRAIITNDEFKHNILGVNAVNIPFDEFKKIVFSARPRTRLYGE